MKEIFNKLSAINVNDKTEKKNGLTYLSWAWAWETVKGIYPDTTYEIKKFENDKPYMYDNDLGYMVFTSITILGLTHEMWLPVMDGANKAMKNKEYTYKVKEYKDRQWTGKFIDKSVYPATMFDINTALMRCLVKNLAMFGLGSYIYAGEDLPSGKPELTDKQLESVLKYKEGDKYIKDGKEQPFANIIKQLESKYTISAEQSKKLIS